MRDTHQKEKNMAGAARAREEVCACYDVAECEGYTVWGAEALKGAVARAVLEPYLNSGTGWALNSGCTVHSGLGPKELIGCKGTLKGAEALKGADERAVQGPYVWHGLGPKQHGV
jgi:hypothetical protein